MDGVLFQALVDLAPDGIILVHPSGRIVFVNGQAERLFGYSADEVVGQTIEYLVPERFRDVHLRHQESYHSNPVTRPMGSGLELCARRRDGTELPVEISLSAIPTEDGTYVTAIVRDMTERRALEEERRQLMAQAELQRDRERIARDLHDGVMQSIYAVGLSLLDARQAVAPLAPEAVPVIDEAVHELRQVIDDIRRYVMGLPLDRLHSDIAALLREVLDEVSADSDLATDLEVSGVPPALPEQQALAIYHLARESLTNVRKHAGASSVALRLVTEGDGLVLEIRDDGCGFDVSMPVAHEHMGLRNMRDRVEALGGTVEIESAPGRGTLVRAHLPLALAAP